jgi:hypothetical protein
MKLVRVLSRLAVLSLAAALFVVLTKIYGDSAPPPLPYPGIEKFQNKHRHPPAAPNTAEFTEFIRWGLAVAIFAVAGRKVFRLRLNPASPSEEQPILLGLHRRPQDFPSGEVTTP